MELPVFGYLIAKERFYALNAQMCYPAIPENGKPVLAVMLKLIISNLNFTDGEVVEVKWCNSISEAQYVKAKSTVLNSAFSE